MNANLVLLVSVILLCNNKLLTSAYHLRVFSSSSRTATATAAATATATYIERHTSLNDNQQPQQQQQDGGATNDDDSTDGLSHDVSSMVWNITAVGFVESPYLNKYNTPKQATISRYEGGKLCGCIRIYPQYHDCLQHLDGFDMIWAITYMNRNNGYRSKISPQPRPNSINKPPAEVGLFASRAPHRPNPIAMSALEVTSIDMENGCIYVNGLDLLNNTPVIDIKPYIPAFDSFSDAKAGWMDTITTDVVDARNNGYQTISNKRGERRARSRLRKETQQQQEGNQEGRVEAV